MRPHVGSFLTGFSPDGRQLLCSGSVRPRGRAADVLAPWVERRSTLCAHQAEAEPLREWSRLSFLCIDAETLKLWSVLSGAVLQGRGGVRAAQRMRQDRPRSDVLVSAAPDRPPPHTLIPV